MVASHETAPYRPATGQTFSQRLGNPNWPWVIITAAVLAALILLAALPQLRGDRISASTFGLILGIVSFSLMVIAVAYGVRKHWRLMVAQRTFGNRRRVSQRKQLHDARIQEARSAVVDLQADVSQGVLTDATLIRRRASAILRSAKATRLLRVELTAESGEPLRIWLLPKEPWGNMKQWLTVHKYLGLLAVLLIAFHSGFKLGGSVATSAVILAVIVGLSGLLGVLLYLIVPRTLARIENPMLPPEIQSKIADVDRQISDLLRDKSGPFQELFGSGSELTEEDISKVEEEEQTSLRQMLELQTAKRILVAYHVKHRRYERYLSGWLYVHAPAALALITILLFHIFSILYY